MSSTDGLPNDLQQFILRSLESVEELETLLLLHETSPQKWSVTEIARHLHSQNASIERRLKELTKKKLLSCENDLFWYLPDPPATVKVVDLLATYYKTHRIRIIELLFSKPRQNYQNFADAFKIRRDD